MDNRKGWPELEGMSQLDDSMLVHIQGKVNLVRLPELLHYILHHISIQSRQQPHTMPYAAKAKTQQFTRRKSNLVKKADQLARLCHVDLALIIRKDGRYYTYRSTDHDQWPPMIREIVCVNRAQIIRVLTGL